jgi:hypothetical protein
MDLKACSKHYLSQIKEHDLSIDSESDPDIFRLDNAWKRSLDKSAFQRGLSERKTMPEIICDYINNAQYPPPEIMLTLRDVFTTYFADDETRTLDQLLLPKPIPGAGQYRQIKQKEKAFKRFYNLMNTSRNKGKSRRLVLSNFNFRRLGFTSIESFDRAYMRYMKDNQK